MTIAQTLSFIDLSLHAALDHMSEQELDLLDFGVIGFDEFGAVDRYNVFESAAAGLSNERALGQPLFTAVAPCMNNFLVAQRFDDALASGVTLDATVDYVLTLRMRPVKVKLRLLSNSGSARRYVVVQRRN